MQELCTRRNTLELRGLTQEEDVTPHKSAKSGGKSSQGKNREKKEQEPENYSEDEEDYLKPADSSFRRKVRKAPKGSKKKKAFREVFSLVQDDQHKSVDKKEKGRAIGKTADRYENLFHYNYEGQDQNPNEFQEPRRTFPEEVTIMSSAGEFSSFNLFVSRYVLVVNIRFVNLQSSCSDGNNNGESRAVKKSAVNIERGFVDDGEKRLSLIRGKGGQSKLFFV